MKKYVLLLYLACFVSSPGHAFAWGQTGHRVIGQIAEENLSGRSRAEIELILDGEGLAEASTFADEERSNPSPFWQKDAPPWHYVTIPQGRTYDEMNAPPEGDAVTALQRFSSVVRNKGSSKAEKAVALRILIHIVGDLH